MNKYLSVILMLTFSVISHTTFASQGEYWEVTSKMEMEGMPFAMPAQTIKVCVLKGQDMDPRKMNQGKECQFSDYKASGKKISYKFRCVEKGDTMTGDAEYTLGTNKSEGVMHMSGKSSGHDMKMTQTSSSKLIGGNCDPDQIARDNKDKQDKMRRESQEQLDAMCDSSAYSAIDWVDNYSKFINDKNPCPGKKKQLCGAASKEAPRDANLFYKVAEREELIKGCNINMAATTKAVCKTINDKNIYLLSKYCPAEVKAFKAAQRRKDCEGRSFTAETRAADIKKCMSGAGADDGANDNQDNPPPVQKPVKNRSTAAEQPANPAPSNESGNSDMLDSATKLLKGRFGF